MMKYKIKVNLQQSYDIHKAYVIIDYCLLEKRLLFWKTVKHSKDIKELLRYINKY